MGLFDGVFVAKSLIDDLINGKDFILNEDDRFYCFQTKDLDNCLSNFYVKEDSSFSEKFQESKWVEGDKNAKFPANIGHQEAVGDPYFVEDKRFCYFDFYDVYCTEEERVFVTFTAHVRDGRLHEPIKLKSVKRTILKEEEQTVKPHIERWERIRNSWQWKTADILDKIHRKINKYTLDNITTLSNLLRKSVEEKNKL